MDSNLDLHNTRSLKIKSEVWVEDIFMSPYGNWAFIESIIKFHLCFRFFHVIVSNNFVTL
jgi:hypothetical protein